MAPLLLAGGLAVGLLALVAEGLGADSQDVLFSGQYSLPALVAEDSAKIVLVLVAAKALGYAICLGCGFRGGPVFPAIFLGVGLAMFAVIWLDVSPTLAVAVGTAAGMAAMTKLLIAPLLLAAHPRRLGEQRRRPCRGLRCIAAWVVTQALRAPGHRPRRRSASASRADQRSTISVSWSIPTIVTVSPCSAPSAQRARQISDSPPSRT